MERQSLRREGYRKREEERADVLQTVVENNEVLGESAARLLQEIELASAELAAAKEHRLAAEEAVADLRRLIDVEDGAAAAA